MGSQIPKYVLLKQQIVSWIAEGRFRPGDKLPSENQLAEQYGLSRQTVRQSIGELVQDGRLARVQGKGTFVTRLSAHSRAFVPGRTVGLITTYISDYIFPSIVRGVESVLKDRGYRLLLSSTDNRKDRERESLDTMLAHGISGLIVEPTQSAEGNPNFDRYLALQEHGIPLVMINEQYPDLACDCIKTDDEGGGRLAADHLLELGHRRIAGIFKTDDLQGVERMKGFIRAHRDRRVPVSEDLLVTYVTESKDRRPLQALREFQQSAEPPTALVCYNDQLAVALLHVMRECRLQVPQDLSLVSFDDSFLATATEIKLTTVAHPKSELGERAASALLCKLESPGSDSVGRFVYPPKLIVRQSAAQLK